MSNFVKILIVVGIVGLVTGCDCRRPGTQEKSYQCEKAGGIPITEVNGDQDGRHYLGCYFPKIKFLQLEDNQ